MRVRALWWDKGRLALIDQRLLPQKEKVLRLRTVAEVARAIRTMQVRGAPAIGVAAGFGMALAAQEGRSTPEGAARTLRATRPTAYDLFVGVETMRTAWTNGEDVLAAAEAYREKVVEECRRIGLAGAGLFRHRPNVLTHCNAGALATVEWGTALAPLRVARDRGAKLFVYVDETRPLLQGARLTAWELARERIPHAVIADNAAGHFLRTGAIDAVIVGADRVARNGDFANKIGTYEKAVLAKENGVPFYVAAPWSTFDGSKANGRSIPVEERHEDEVLELAGRRITPRASRARNPAFDVTPARYVTAFVTPDGVVRPSELRKRLPRTRRPEGAAHLGTRNGVRSSRRSR
ncbi:MAG: S-methyl-5-thioribose-1-phosphate isomerase [Thermoplasmata archaeon]|nr:S-methyl-5-thioribose-1-phosphate isomerase [Thermoplasmata archaeon]